MIEINRIPSFTSQKAGIGGASGQTLFDGLFLSVQMPSRVSIGTCATGGDGILAPCQSIDANSAVLPTTPAGQLPMCPSGPNLATTPLQDASGVLLPNHPQAQITSANSVMQTDKADALPIEEEARPEPPEQQLPLVLLAAWPFSQQPESPTVSTTGDNARTDDTRRGLSSLIETTKNPEKWPESQPQTPLPKVLAGQLMNGDDFPDTANLTPAGDTHPAPERNAQETAEPQGLERKTVALQRITDVPLRGVAANLLYPAGKNRPAEPAEPGTVVPRPDGGDAQLSDHSGVALTKTGTDFALTPVMISSIPSERLADAQQEPRALAHALTETHGLPATASDSFIQKDIWLEQLARDITHMRTSQDRVQFTVSPGELGPFDVDLSQSEKGFAVHITAHSDDSRTMLTQSQPQLRQEFRNVGLTLSESTFSGTPTGAGTSDHQNPRPAYQQAMQTTSSTNTGVEETDNASTAGTGLFA